MKILTTYSSWTGNTKKVANSIYEKIGGDIMPINEVTEFDKYDFIAIGFFVDKGFAPDEAKNFMEKIQDKQVGIFITLGAEPDSDHAKEVVHKVRDFMEKNNNKVICEFICQGAIDPKLIERMRQMGQETAHPITPDREAKWKKASTHPDEQDLLNAKKAFEKLSL